MEESTKKKIHEIEIIAAVLLLIVSFLSFFPNAGITGYVSVESKTQAVDLAIVNSQSYILTTNAEEQFHLTSLKLSGEVIGDGIAKAYIDNGQGQKILIYSNVAKKAKGLTTVTGMDKITGGVVGVDSETDADSLIIDYLENIDDVKEELTEIADDQELLKGQFNDECTDSCFIEMLLDKDIGYQLLFYVEEGTILNIYELIYTIRKD